TGSGADCAGGSGAHARKIFANVAHIQTVGRNERVDVESACFRSGRRSHFDAADSARRNPGQDLPDLVLRKLRSPQGGDHVRRPSPTLRMSDQSEIGYTGNCVTHANVTSPGSPSASRVFRYCCNDAPRSSAALRLTSKRDGLTQALTH